jgi:hypothetical protein
VDLQPQATHGMARQEVDACHAAAPRLHSWDKELNHEKKGEVWFRRHVLNWGHSLIFQHGRDQSPRIVHHSEFCWTDQVTCRVDGRPTLIDYLD